ncbi:right-handed parallel beta-helix repeat-containing protein [Kineosporia babensis]|uniref:Right-handed parallel beta-helix repeat-containing protein n=1 Tax=Kineosporia babensis TaxID=499548 RepID=A0A9X1NDK1_9ACTN|nr:right-handed parallel beta-helix repeat-containing protein [Kineosporia babensis]MCD5313202.1 right-handed parallel beta-helix repeat-containing protein [Kineosporia babensis]
MSAKRFRVISGLAAVVLAGGLVTAFGVSGVTAAERPAGGKEVEGLAARSARVDPDRQAEIVAGEDRRVTQALLNAQVKKEKKITGPYRAQPNGQFTLVLTARRKPYSWTDLRKLSADKLVPQADGSFLLREHILVGPGATLSISPSRPLKIKMSSGPEGFTSIVTDGGRIRLNGSATAPISIQSWDESHGRPDTRLSDGRAYVRASGQLVVSYTKFNRLGFWSGRTGGVSVVSASSTPNTELNGNAATGVTDDPVAKRATSHTDILPAGKLPSTLQEDESGSFASAIQNATMTGNAFGLFISGSSGPRVTDSVISKSLVDGLVLHRNVDSATVTGVRVERSAVDGVVINRNVEGSVLNLLDVRENGRDGVVISGSPMADGPSPSGAAVRPFGNNVLTTSKSSNNGRIGVHVAGGVALTVQGNTVTGGHSGIVVSDRAKDILLSSNTVKDAKVNGIQVRDESKVELTSNNVIGAATGVHVRDAVATLRDNSTSGATLHAFTFVGAVAGSVANGNQLRGSGTSAIDTVRVSGDQPQLIEIDDSGWSRTVTKDSLLSILLHPLTMVWIGVGLLLLLMSRPRRGGTRTPYLADPLLGKGGPTGEHPPASEAARERENPVQTHEKPEVPHYEKLPYETPQDEPQPSELPQYEMPQPEEEPAAKRDRRRREERTYEPEPATLLPFDQPDRPDQHQYAQVPEPRPVRGTRPMRAPHPANEPVASSDSVQDPDAWAPNPVAVPVPTPVRNPTTLPRNPAAPPRNPITPEPTPARNPATTPMPESRPVRRAEPQPTRHPEPQPEPTREPAVARNETLRRSVPKLKPRRNPTHRPALDLDLEPPVAADWRNQVTRPRQQPDAEVDVREGREAASPELTPAVGTTVIDLAIAESRRNPVPPRRRRVVGR